MKDPRFEFETDVSPSEILETLLDKERRMGPAITERSLESPARSTSSDPSMASPNFRFGNLANKQQELIKDFYLRVSGYSR